MISARAVHGEAEDWAHAAKVCADGLLAGGPAGGGGYNLGFIYVTDALVDDLTSILTYLRQKTGIEHWVGSVGVGIFANLGEGPGQLGVGEYFHRPAIAALAMSVAEQHFRILPTIKNDPDELPGDIVRWINDVQCHFGIIHGDRDNPKAAALVSGLSQLTNGFLVGGFASSSGTVRQIAGRVTDGGVCGLLMAPQVTVATCQSQGCLPIGDGHVISDCVDNVLIGLDGERALDVFKNDIGPRLAADLGKVAGQVHAALPIEGSDTGDYMVRNLVGIDPQRGWLAIGEEVSPGERVMFVRRDPESAEMDLRKTLHRLKHRLVAPPRAGLYFSCLGRGPSLFEQEGHEVAIITELLGNFPLVGFYGNGEISSDRIYGHTGVLVLFL